MGKDARKPPTAGPRRDVRVDRIGFVGELVKQWIEGDDGVKARVKADMAAGETVEGDFFEGRLDAATETQIAPERIIRLYDDGRISAGDLAGLITVKAAAAEKLLDRATYRRIATKRPGASRLVVKRRAGVQVELLDAVKGISACVGAENGRAAA